MIQRPAPLRADLAGGPKGGVAAWLSAQDGVRVRAAYWPAASNVTGRGSVLLLPGRTEFIEKYADLARVLTQKGWGVALLDWRGQGLSDRLTPDPMMGHVEQFQDYQHDLDALLAWLGHEGIAAPHVMFAHSMGGLIGLRALYRDLGLKAAVFSAPMWGIQLPIWRQPVASVLSRLKRDLRQDFTYAPTTSAQSYVLSAPFAGNNLTGDPENWSQLQSLTASHAGFALGGPSLRWVRQALREARLLMAKPAPDVPVITALGSHEAIVRADVIHKRMVSWPKGRLDLYPHGHHELAWESPAIQAQFFDRIAAHFAQYS